MDKLLRPHRFAVNPNDNNSEKEWKHWRKTFDNFTASITQENVNKLTLLTNFLSPDVYDYIADANSFDSALATLENIYIKPKNEVFSRHLLASRRQQPGETIDQFIQALHGLGKPCNFKAVDAVTHSNEYIRDAFINGLLSTQIRQRLLENQTLDLSTAITQARSLESAQRNNETYSVPNSDTCGFTTISKHSLYSDLNSDSLDNVASMSRKSYSCFFCGGNQKHPRTSCPARESTCNKCSKKGHWAKVCKSKDTAGKTSAAVSGKSFNIGTNSSNIAASNSLSHSHATIEAKCKDRTYRTLVDTGSSESFIHSNIAQELGLKLYPCPHDITMADTSLTMKVTHYCVENISIDKRNYSDTKLLVMNNLCENLILGRDFLKRHKSLNVEFGGKEPALELTCGLTEAKVNPPRLFGFLTPDVKPIATKSRKYSNSDKAFIRDEISKLLQAGIIEPSQSPWRSQVLVTTNDRHKKRMVVDYSPTINRFTELDAYPVPHINDLVNTVAQYSFYSTYDLKSAYHQVPISDSEKLYTAFEANGQLYQFCRIPFGLTNAVAQFQRIMDEVIQVNNLKDTYAYLDNVLVCGKNQEDLQQNDANFLQAVAKHGLTLNDDKTISSTNSITFLGHVISGGKITPDPERLEPLRRLPVPHDTQSLRRCLGLFSYYSQWIPRFSDKINQFNKVSNFPLDGQAVTAFENLKREIEGAALHYVDENVPFVVETDASNHAIAATLNQSGRPVAFFSRTLNDCEKKHSAIEKEAYAIVEALRKWKHYLLGRHFQIITDQKSVSFMFDNKQPGKIKNDKIMRWRIELSNYSFDIIYRPGDENTAADALSRISNCSSTTHSQTNLQSLHEMLCHPGITRFLHFIRVKNLPYSVEQVKKVCSECPVCCELKPNFYKSPEQNKVIKATQPFERLSLDFKGPLPSTTRNTYILTIVDEYSRFPIAVPCPDLTAETVIKKLTDVFCLFGTPAYVHSDRGTNFMSHELKAFLGSKGVGCSRTTPYNPRGNGQCERYNGIIWKTVTLCLRSKNLPISKWELALPDALHSIRSLLCTATNQTPHERLFNFQRRSCSGNSLPTWLSTPGPVLMRRYVRHNKHEPYVDPVQLLEANSKYAHVKLKDGREETVSLRDLAPIGEAHSQPSFSSQSEDTIDTLEEENPDEPQLRRSTRERREPERYGT